MAWNQKGIAARTTTWMFKIKLKELINDIHKKHILGSMISRIYVIEFQKHGLSMHTFSSSLLKVASHTRLRMSTAWSMLNFRIQRQTSWPTK
jgi:hypothetical protein